MPNKKSMNGATAESKSDGSVSPIVINGQYIKDLSFESPGSPQTLAGGHRNPNLNISLNVEVAPMADTTYETVLKIKAHAQHEEKTVFIVEMAYAGVFTLQGIPEAQHRPVLVVEGARLLFPFARAILANVTRDGGFPPLMLGPIDFVDMFRRSQKNQTGEKDVANPTTNA